MATMFLNHPRLGTPSMTTRLARPQGSQHFCDDRFLLRGKGDLVVDLAQDLGAVLLKC